MAISAENLLLSIVEEATYGVTPATPVFLETSIVSESLSADATFTESQMISGGTRGIPDTVMTQLATAGDLSRELVFEANTDLLFEALLGNKFGNDPHSNGTSADEVYDFVDLISLSIEKRWTMDATPTYNYHEYSGQVPSSGSLEFSPGEIITQNTTFVGSGIELGDTAIVGSTYTGEAGNSPMTTPKVTSMTLTTVDAENPVGWISSACFTNLGINIENNTRALSCIGSLSAREAVLGRINVTGTGSIYYASDDPIESLLAETEYGLLVEAADLAGNSYQFWLPRTKFTIANVNATGQSTDVMTEFTLQALESNTLKYTMRITKTTA